ncbi:hypothetical protein STCU_11790 [Strigomonas culicis]|uniref:Uncharacterized protein n=1 Tax=Strigomonas culicis TaxID=28005 RepID=S9TFM3_9TRYP|nr:hypothetical protein STCU_11790 [Strigomonas culicis]|eukprot:EPY15754.1 hypothetical protein STCU_11790 [Strigomonas culicis]
MDALASPPPPLVPVTAERGRTDERRVPVRALETPRDRGEGLPAVQVAELQRDVHQLQERVECMSAQAAHEPSPAALEQQDRWRRTVNEDLGDLRRSLQAHQTLLQEETDRLRGRMEEIAKPIQAPAAAPPPAITREEVRELLQEAQVRQERALTRLELVQSTQEGELQQVRERAAFLETKREELSQMVERNQKAVTQLTQVVELYEERLHLFESERTNAAADRTRRGGGEVTEAALTAREERLWDRTTQLVGETATALREERNGASREATAGPTSPPAVEADTDALAETVYQRVLLWLEAYLAMRAPAAAPAAQRVSLLDEDRDAAMAEDLEALREQVLTAVVQVGRSCSAARTPGPSWRSGWRTSGTPSSACSRARTTRSR